MAHNHSYPCQTSYDFKIGIFGAAGVGKTSLVRGFFGQKFVEKHIPTIDDYYVHAMHLEGGYFSTCIIDTAGSYTFPVMQRLAMEQSHGFLVLYALDNEKSFVEALRLLDEIFSIKTRIDSWCRRIVVNLVATKLDVDCRETKISRQRALDAMKIRPWIVGEHIEISARASGFRVSLPFHSLMRNILTECQLKEKKKGRKRLARKLTSYRLVIKEKKRKRRLRRTIGLFSCAGP